MYWIALTLTLLVALLHVYFLVLEMFLWARPLGLKTFRNTPEKAGDTRVLAANQGLYNGFLAAGIVVGLVIDQPVLVTFSLACAFSGVLRNVFRPSGRVHRNISSTRK